MTNWEFHPLTNFVFVRLSDRERQSTVENHHQKNTLVLVRYLVNILRTWPNKKTLGTPPKLKDKEMDIAYNFMVDPMYPKAYSEHFGDDSRRQQVESYKR